MIEDIESKFMGVKPCLYIYILSLRKQNLNSLLYSLILNLNLLLVILFASREPNLMSKNDRWRPSHATRLMVVIFSNLSTYLRNRQGRNTHTRSISLNYSCYCYSNMNINEQEIRLIICNSSKFTIR